MYMLVINRTQFSYLEHIFDIISSLLFVVVQLMQSGVVFNIKVIGAYDWSGNHAIIPELWMLPHFLPIHPGMITPHNLPFI